MNNMKNSGLIAGGFAHPIENGVIFTPLPENKKGSTANATLLNNDLMQYQTNDNSDNNANLFNILVQRGLIVNYSSMPNIFSQIGRVKSLSPFPQGDKEGANNLTIIINAIIPSAACLNLFFIGYPFGSMPCRNNSLRARSFSQLPRLTFSRSAAASSCSLNSGTSLILNIGDFPAPFGLLSLFTVDMYRPVEIVLMLLGLYTNIFNPDRTTPRSARDTIEAFNHNVKRGNTMAMYKSTQTHPKFLWRFFSCQQFKYFLVEASNEQEARSMLPDSPCLFSARIRQGVTHG